jgi:enamine deaminase RidA (YjgF/YER057c/UK114 family)
VVSAKGSQPNSPERRLQDLGIQLPAAPTPFGTYVEALQTGNLLFLSGMLPIVDHKPRYLGRLGKELDAEAGRDAAYIDQPRVADAVSDLFRDIFGTDNMAVRSVIGVASLPLGVPIELEVIFEVAE